MNRIGAFVIFMGIVAMIGSYLHYNIKKESQSDDSDNSILEIDRWKRENIMKWKNTGSGLSLTLLNSLDVKWDGFFDSAVSDWGAAPSLALSSSKYARPTTIICNQLSGVMRACNDEYGDTGWLGINEAVYYTYNNTKNEVSGINENIILSSVVKINDSYLEGASDFKKQYVLCHEIGHGFGLRHRDDDRNNEDLGSCLDISNNFTATMRPDSIDFNNLRDLYGNIITSRNLRYDRKERSQDFEEIKQMSQMKHGRKRLLRRSAYTEVYETTFNGGITMISTLLLHN